MLVAYTRPNVIGSRNSTCGESGIERWLPFKRRGINARNLLRRCRATHVKSGLVSRADTGSGVIEAPAEQRLRFRRTRHHRGKAARRVLSVRCIERCRERELQIGAYTIINSRPDHYLSRSPHRCGFEAHISCAQRCRGKAECRAVAVSPCTDGNETDQKSNKIHPIGRSRSQEANIHWAALTGGF